MEYTPTIAPTFLVRVGGRLFRITALDESFTSCDDQWTPVDVRDSRTGFESQAIILTEDAAWRGTILAEPQVQDAIRSSFLNATTVWNNRRIVQTGEHLPEGFTITIL